MIYIILLIIFVNIANSTCPPGTKSACVKHQDMHTNLYETVWVTRKNRNNYFYHPQTFGIDIASYYGKSPCDRVDTPMLLKSLNKNKCEGEWCIRGEFGNCGSGGQSCYQMEHIIDKKCCHDRELNPDIWANVVMAYGKWNGQVSNSRIGGCDNAYNEKKIIYGEDIVKRVLREVEKCRNSNRRSEEQEPNETVYDESYEEPVNGFDFSECDKSCTCESNKYLDILCGCDYSETDFDPSCEQTQLQSNLEFYRGAFVSTNIFLIMVILLLIIGFVVVMREKNKGFDIPPEFDVGSHESSEDTEK